MHGKVVHEQHSGPKRAVVPLARLHAASSARGPALRGAFSPMAALDDSPRNRSAGQLNRELRSCAGGLSEAHGTTASLHACRLRSLRIRSWVAATSSIRTHWRGFPLRPCTGRHGFRRGLPIALEPRQRRRLHPEAVPLKRSIGRNDLLLQEAVERKFDASPCIERNQPEPILFGIGFVELNATEWASRKIGFSIVSAPVAPWPCVPS